MTAAGKGKQMATRKIMVFIPAALTLAFIIIAAGNTAAAPAKGGKVGAYMSAKGRANTNAQWSADPDKGWVRAEERHRIEKDKNSKRNQVDRKGNGSKKKF